MKSTEGSVAESSSDATKEVQRLEEAGHWLLQLREDALSEEQMQRWLDWCEADSQNLEAFERVQRLWRGIPDQALAPIDLQKASALPKRSFVQRQWTRWITGASRRRSMQWKPVTLAAGVVAVASFVSLAIYERWNAVDWVAAAKIEAPPRINRNSVLPDGSRVDLSAGSAIAMDYGHGERRLKMRNGTAFFRVQPDKARPFVVDVGPVSVTAVGTAFNIRRNGERVVVTVEEGTVRIDKEKDQGSLETRAGYQLTYDARSGEVRLMPVNPATELAWRQGRLIYDGEPLEAVIENVNRYSTKKITLADPALGQLRFTGTVFVDSIETWLGALPLAFPVTVSSNKAHVILSRDKDSTARSGPAI